ncbi:hypothetical protein CAL14_20340 [Bordetella genomosp. 9]|uniref:FHA domain-containing protein n=1 Tax=Bordetella genomosp. 9 TaxID=1416803 RepID=UPI000A292B89|nr:FHA domain-containing protein [Bordetella genomosp. 9]ARP92346.1 hypothetical protein CAL14_20340 [Bordetella genomosp. 9]
MKLTVNRRTDAQTFPPVQAVFTPPGGTIGRSADNHLALPDAPGALCRVQSALRYRDGAWHLANLSGMAGVVVNGQPLARGRECVLQNGDEVVMGAYVLRASEDAAAAPAQANDVFGDLIGPGTLPVASPADLSVHPFDMDSGASRNPEDPLAQLADDAWRPAAASGDPLALFPDHGAPASHHLSDPTPAMLPAGDPLAARRPDPIADTLEGDHGRGRDAMRDDTPEFGSPLVPPRVRRE